VRRHELTHKGPLADRIELIQHLHTQVSPILLMHRGATPPAAPPEAPVFEARSAGETHRLWQLRGDQAEAALATLQSPLYIADGHHRFATAAATLEEARSRASHWTGDEPENFVLAAMVAADDLVVRPTHRLLHGPIDPAVEGRLGEWFDVTTVDTAELMERVSETGRSGMALGILGLAPGVGHLLRAGDRLDAAFPAVRSDRWRALDVAVVSDVVLQRCLGVDAGAAAAAGELSYSPDSAFTAAEVAAGRATLALLLNPTPVEQVLAISDADETMPQKSTYFYPKLPTGLVLYPHD